MLNAVRIGVALMILSLIGCTTPTPQEPVPPTKAEYRAALQAAADCITKEGYPARVQWSDLSNDYGIAYEGPKGADGDSPEVKKSGKIYDRCFAEHAQAVADAYQAASRLTGAERDKAKQRLVECLDAAGVKGLDPGQTDSRVYIRAIAQTHGDDPDAHMAAMVCMERYRGVWPAGDFNSP